MATAPLEGTIEESLRCPTCKAKQEWSDTCRRCKCDLSLLHGVARARRESRRRCLWCLRTGQLSKALQHARRCHALGPDEPSSRLLAVCHLLAGDWLKAVAAARLVGEET